MSKLTFQVARSISRSRRSWRSCCSCGGGSCGVVDRCRGGRLDWCGCGYCRRVAIDGSDDGIHQRVDSLSACVQEVVHADVPDHGTTDTVVQDVLGLGDDRGNVVIAHPVPGGRVVGVGSHQVAWCGHLFNLSQLLSAPNYHFSTFYK